MKMVETSCQYYFDAYSFKTDILTDDSTQSVKTDSSGKIRCRLCEEHITDGQSGIYHNGNHIHCERNPGGHKFRFATYQDAPGCLTIGEASFEHSWFSGYNWQIALCRSCSEHLGWLFSGNSRFYGLIIDKLIDEDN
jgi:hypothetical protein